jgi:hypothetical protein
MKVRIVLTAFVLAALTASAAIAAPPPGKGKPASTGVGCKPAVAVILSGTLTADGTASSLTVHVTGGNRFALAYKNGAQPITVTITTATKINRQGDHNPLHLKTGDRVNIQARQCKADLANGATPTLTASRVTAHPASS